jgi:hypothetical protein
MKNVFEIFSGKKSLLLPIIFAFAVFAGCEDFFITEVDDIYLSNVNQKLVVNSYISPQDTIIRVFVNRSTAFGNNSNLSPDVAGNADVYMGRKGGELKKLTWLPERRFFGIAANEIGIEPGVYYVLKVQSHQGEVVEAECYVPEMDFSDFEVDPPQVSSNDEWGYNDFYLNWRLRATQGNEEKYYSTGAWMAFYDIWYMNDPPDTNFVYRNRFRLEKGQEFFAAKEGRSFSFMVKDTKYFGPESVDSMFIYLLQTDIHYYRYHKSASSYFYYNDDFPFSEAVHIYTNIQGGLGVFAGYNRRNYYVPFD